MEGSGRRRRRFIAAEGARRETGRELAPAAGARVRRRGRDAGPRGATRVPGTPPAGDARRVRGRGERAHVLEHRSASGPILSGLGARFHGSWERRAAL